VHAGIIEPGHFRFSVAGEEILFLEPRLGYSHKGVEKLLETAPLHEKIRLSERISGDSSYSHSLTLMMALESLRGESADERTGHLRVIFCELERLANHLGDIGAIMTDAGFNFGGAHGSRLREMVMQINERLTGSRFLRGVHVQTCGLSGENGVAPEAARSLGAELEALRRDFSEVMAIAEESHSLQNRLRNTGILSPRIAREHGVIGVAGKAVGHAADARVDYPYAAYGLYPLEIALEEGGDVHARFQVRVKEVYSSIDLIKRSLTDLSGGGAFSAPSPSVGQFRKNAYVVSIVEGWRGDIVYLLSTDSNGDISRVAVRDPSFLNWTALSYAAAGNMVPDFPLINKSFSLSYSGNDL
jgi:Ni,Fe-hydrogenase III large subunit